MAGIGSGKPVTGRRQAGRVLSLQPGLLRSELLLLQAVLGKFICCIYALGGEIDAGSLRGAAVVIDDNPTGTVGHGSREHRRGISIGDLGHTTTRSARCGTVRGQPEEEVISSAGDIRIEKLRPSGAAGSGGSEKLP